MEVARTVGHARGQADHPLERQRRLIRQRRAMGQTQKEHSAHTDPIPWYLVGTTFCIKEYMRKQASDAVQ